METLWKVELVSFAQKNLANQEVGVSSKTEFFGKCKSMKKNDPSEKSSTYFTFVGLAFGMIGNYALSGFVFKRS